MAVNQQQREQWNVARQAAEWPKRERITTCVTAPLLELLALQRGERVLEVGCGGGLAAIEAARVVAPSGEVVGFDISAPLAKLATSRATAARTPNVRFLVGDAQVDDIPAAPFDAAMSQFGVMFFADPVAAFANIRRHLRLGGRIAFACWQSAVDNPWFPGPILARYLPPPSPNPTGAPPPGPFAFADPVYTKDVLERAGFESVAFERFATDVAVPEDSLFDRETLDTRIDEDKREQARRDLKQLASSMRQADGRLRLHLAAQFFSARNPG
jgi:SAM-dependent methyltransferase